MNEHQPSLVNLCRLMQTLLLIAVALIVFISAYHFWGAPTDMIGDGIFNEVQYAVTEGELRIRENVLIIYDNVAILIILFQIYLFFNNIKHGKLFTRTMINNAKFIGIMFIVTYVLGFFLRILVGMLPSTDGADYTIMVNIEIYGIMQLLLGVSLFILGSILEKAKELKDEHDLVI